MMFVKLVYGLPKLINLICLFLNYKSKE